MAATETRSEKLDLRLTPAAKRTLQIAARASRRSVSEFVLESALACADETLDEGLVFGMGRHGGSVRLRWLSLDFTGGCCCEGVA